MQKIPDYIIVGSGPAGCVLASRLTEDSTTNVLVLEAGGSDRKMIIQMPAAVPFAYQSKEINWGFQSGPEPHLVGRFIDEKRGRVLGGSSCINAMIFNRGNPRDFDGWERLGAKGWNWRSCLPYFQRMETFADAPADWRGDSGPLKVSRCNATFPIYDDFLRAGEMAGFAITPDHNGRKQEGMHIAQAYIGDGVRSSASTAYLRPALNRKNLRVQTDVHVTKVLMDGLKAIGVEVVHKGETKRLMCQREVILAAGAFGSPQILMQSGIGDPDQLRPLGIQVKHALRDVGDHLENHPGVNLQFTTEKKHSLVSKLGPVGKARLGLEWLLLRQGLGTTNFFEVGAFLPTRSDVDYANVQIEILPMLRKIVNGKLIPIAGCNFWVGLARPASRGHVRLKSANPFQAPEIVFNHMAEYEDMRDLAEGIDLAHRIVAQSPLASRIKAEISPGTHMSRKQLEAWIAANVGTSYHPSGTCRMGPGDASVVDTAGRVHGLTGLRVVDASIMPKTVTGNISATVYMMAEKISDEIRGKRPLQPVEV